MTASELKYLITADTLNDDGNGAKMAAMAQKLGVSKVSVYRAVERLIASGYVEQNGKRIFLTEKGSNEIADYTAVVDFIVDKLRRHCNTPEEKAFDEAIGAACALGKESRNSILALAGGRAVGRQ